MRVELVVRFDYGSIVPWVRRVDDAWHAVAGPDGLELRTPVAARRVADLTTTAEFTRRRGERSRSCSVGSRRTIRDPCRTTRAQLVEPHDRSTGGAGRRGARTSGEWREPVLRSLLTLESLTYAADRRHRRRAHDLAARDARRLAQLGLPLLLGPRRDAHARGAPRSAATTRKRSGGASGCCARPPASPRTLQTMYGVGGRAPAHRARARLAAGLRQRRGRCAPATPRTSSCSSTCTAS